VLKLSDVLAELPVHDVPPPLAPLSDASAGNFLDALRQTRANRSAAARLLGMGRSTLYRRLSVLEAEGTELPRQILDRFLPRRLKGEARTVPRVSPVAHRMGQAGQRTCPAGHRLAGATLQTTN
jgi:hypothetical protein